MNSHLPQDATHSNAASSVLLYDGTCGLCARSVQFILSHEGDSRTLKFATLEGPLGELYRKSNKYAPGTDSVVWLELTSDQQVKSAKTRSEAVVAILTYLGGPWTPLARVARFMPRASLDLLYRAVASTRYRFFGRDTGCLLPTPAQRRRFLD